MTSKLIRQACEQYDPSILLRFSQNDRAVVKQVADKMLETKKDTLSQKQRAYLKMVSNQLSTLQMRSTSVIFGPISLSEHYSKKYDKRIYIFGERHNMVENFACKERSMNITCFLDYTLTLSPKFIDFFIEKGYMGKLEDDIDYDVACGIPGTYLMNDIARQFLPNIQRGRRNEEIPNARIHWADFRMHPQSEDVLTTEMPSFNIRTNWHHRSGWESYVRNLKDSVLVKRFRTLQGIMDGMKEYASSPAKVKKQLDASVDPEARERILAYYDKCKTLRLVQPSVEISVNFYRNAEISKLCDDYLRNPMNNDAQSTIYEIAGIILSLVTCNMDLYLAGRMFRTFRNMRGQYSKPPQNIIVYVGDKHAREYRGLLDDMGFEKRGEVYSRDDRCIDLSGFKQPFFS